MKYLRFILVCMMAMNTASAYAAKQEDALYSEILNATFTHEKMPAVQKLAALKTKDSEKKLIALMNDSSMWNREAGIAGLFMLKNESTGKILINRMLDDSMSTGMIASGLRKESAVYRTILITAYQAQIALAGTENADKRSLLLDIIGTAADQPADVFLRSIIADQQSPDNEEAFKIYIQYYSKKQDGWIRGNLDNPRYRLQVLTHIARTGTRADLPLFTGILSRKEPLQHRLVALSAVNTWGNPSEKQQAYFEALKDPDAMLRAGSMRIFTNTQSEAIMRELCRLTKTAETQNERIHAAQQLSSYTAPLIIPYLILILDEEYIPDEQSGMDIFLGAITLGMTTVLDHLSKKSRKDNFFTVKSDIAAQLKKMTGADNGTSFDKWKEWAVFNGYSLRGENIIQYLFSGYPRRRILAQEHAMKLLGYAGSREFYQANGTIESDTALSLKLADMLIRKGFLADEEE